MKKHLLVSIATVVLAFAFTANAAAKRWSFTNWSSSTMSQVVSAEDWTKAETASKSYITGDEIRWVLTPTFSDDGYLMAAGSTIAEFEGLRHDGVDPYELAMAFDYGTTTDGNNWGPFHAPSYLWVAGNTTSIIVPDVKTGTILKLGSESHKPSEARGFKLVVNGEEVAAQTSKEYTEFEFAIPEGDTEYVDVSIQAATKGLHLYFIEAETRDESVEVSNVAYLYDEIGGKAFEELPLYQTVMSMENVKFEPINVGTALPEKEALMAYDAVIIDGGATASESFVAFLKENIFWQPVINFNKDIAVALGFGEAIELDNELAWMAKAGHAWVRDYTNFADEDNRLTVVTNGEVFPNALHLTGHANADKVIIAGTDEYETPDTVIAYSYNTGHNTYIYYGVPYDFADGTELILMNIIKNAIYSKAAISATPKPAAKATHGHQITWVTLSDANKNAKIYYTTDGTAPTLESPLYADTLTFTQEAQLISIAIADGYTVSDVDTFEVKLYNKAKTPTLTVTGNEEKGDVVITLACEEEGVDIWYNFTGSDGTTDKSTKYDGPITIKRKAQITAFASSDTLDLVKSDLLVDSVFANMKNVRRDEIAHFSVSQDYNVVTNFLLDGEPQTAWANSDNYYFTWGKNAASAYANDTVRDALGDPVLDEFGEAVVNKIPLKESVTQNIKDSLWSITSCGQVVLWQKNGPSANIGNGGGYNPERAEYYIERFATKNDIVFAGVASGEKSTATIRTNVKYAGPFNVYAVVANTGTGEKSFALQVSKDGETWETLGDTLVTSTVKRLYRTYEESYEGTDEVFVRMEAINGNGAGIHDIYIFNAGEKSQAEMEYYATGIKDVNATEETIAPVKAVKMIKDGKIVIVTAKGTYSLTGVQLR